MATIPSYAHLSADDQRECAHWNAAITANPEIAMRPALSKPSAEFKLFSGGYTTYEELKKALDDYTLPAGWRTVTKHSNDGSVSLACSKGATRASSSNGKKNSSTIKWDCKWSALAHQVREVTDDLVTRKWYLRIDHSSHKQHGPELYPESQRGYIKADDEMKQFCTIQVESDPTITPSRVERALLLEFPTAKVSKNYCKNFIAKWRKDRIGHFKPSTATLAGFEEKGYWYRWCTNETTGEIRGMFWATDQQIR